MSDAQIRATLTEILSHLQDGKEIRTYLQRFGAADLTRFAVIKVGGSVLDTDMDRLAAGVSLLQTMGLSPIIVHGAGPQLDALVQEAGVDRGKVDGLRFTSPDIMEIVARTATRMSVALAAAIGRYGGAASPVSPMALRARIIDAERYGLVGAPVSVDMDTLDDLTRAGAMPIVSCLGWDPQGRIVNVNADAAARALAFTMKPLKVLFLTGAGGLLDRDGAVIPAINLDAELERMIEEGVVHSGMRLKLEEIAALLEELPLSSSVSITSASGLVRELFTHGGQGTLVRRGERIDTLADKAALDTVRLSALITESFGKTLAGDYFDDLPFRRAYTASDYRAAAILTDLQGVALMDKFVVSQDARGAGLSHALWRMLREDEPVMFWRSRQENGFNSFYMAQADGFVRRGPWSVFWAGDIPMDAAAPIIEAVAARPPSFLEDRAVLAGELDPAWRATS